MAARARQWLAGIPLLWVALACAQGEGASSGRNLPLRRDAGTEPLSASWGVPALVAGLAGAAGAWVLWRRAQRRPGGARAGGAAPVQRLSSQALTPQASVHCVRWNGEELLLGCTAQQVTLLARRPMAGDAGPAP